MLKPIKPVAIPAVLLFFAAGVFLVAWHGDGGYAEINPGEVVGRVELPPLTNTGRTLDKRRYQKASAQENSGQNPSLQALPDDINTELPDFSDYKDVKKKKTAFFNFLRPIVRKENREVLKQRAYVLVQWQRFMRGEQLSADTVEHLHKLADNYRVDTRYSDGGAFFREMLMHIDKIPVSLALIQAAKESAWGTSYFARKGNNLFGQWCFKKGCGIVPRRRPEGASYEVRAFDDVSDSVSAYIRNLNSHPAYKELRLERYRMRLAGREPDPHLMAGGLEQYSEIGMKYVQTVRQMIRGNEKFMGIHESSAGSGA